MPSKNLIKIYVKDAYYHIYNRGVEKRRIFKETQDYKVFLSYLKEYLSPPPKPGEISIEFNLRGRTFKAVPRTPKNYFGKIELLSFCLMPNHFHLLVKNLEKRAIKNFTQSLITRYAMYFNKKYQRVGPLFQGKYKAAMIIDEPYLLHLSRYIHLNPKELDIDLKDAYSSYADYLDLRKTLWLNPSLILSFFDRSLVPEFKKVRTYQEFVENYLEEPHEVLGNICLD